MELLKDSGRYEKKTAEIIPITTRIMKIATLATSAGTGNYIEDEIFEEVEITEPVPEKASFGVHLDGDSMEPRFKNEELVWIEKCDYLDSGEIGLFFLNGKTYFKKFQKKETGTFLVSLNKKYEPIPVSEFDNFKIFGRLAVE